MRELRRQEIENPAEQLENEVQQEIAAAKAKLRTTKLQGSARTHGRAGEEGHPAALGRRAVRDRQERPRQRTCAAESLLEQKTQTAVHSELATTNMRVIEQARGYALRGLAAQEAEPAHRRARRPRTGHRRCVLPQVARQQREEQRRSRGAVAAPHSRRRSRASDCRARWGALRDSLRQGDSVSGLLTTLRGDYVANGNGAADLDDTTRDLVVVQKPWSPVAETLRMLRTALLFSSNGAPPPQVILVTSASSPARRSPRSTWPAPWRPRPASAADRRRPAPPALPQGARSAAGARSVELPGRRRRSRADRARIATPLLAFVAAGLATRQPRRARRIGSSRPTRWPFYANTSTSSCSTRRRCCRSPMPCCWRT